MADPSLYFHSDNSNLNGINALIFMTYYVVAIQISNKKSKLTYDKLETTGTEELSFTFAGPNIHRRPDESDSIDQLFYQR